MSNAEVIETDNTANKALTVGDRAIVSQRSYGLNKQVGLVTIDRETETVLVDGQGSKWRKDDGAKVPQYKLAPKFLMSVSAFQSAAKG